MSYLVLEEAREYVIPLFDVAAEGDGIHLESRKFLGTAFFVSPQGDAMTAAHVLPDPAAMAAASRRLIAIVRKGDKDVPVWVTHAATFPASDMALLKIGVDSSAFLPLSAREIHAGEDVLALGIPEHEVWGRGKEMRLLKGHVTMSHRHLELNFPIPSGMSGCPVFCGNLVIGYSTGAFESETELEAREQVVQVTPTREIVTITEMRRVIAYGLATPISHFKGHTTPVLDGLSLTDFIRSRGGTMT